MAQTTCFGARRVLWGIRTTDGVIYGKYAPKPVKVDVNRQFQAKIPKYKTRIISVTTNQIKPKCEHRTGAINYTSVVADRSKMADVRHFENRYDITTLPRMVRFV